MAASDQHYRNMNTLDVLFGVACVLMLLTILLMFAQDYFKEFKSEQRVFRDVETALAERQMADQLFALVHGDATHEYDEAFHAVEEAQKAVEINKGDEEAKKNLEAARAQLKEAENKLPAAYAALIESFTNLGSEIDTANAGVKEARAANESKIHDAEVRLAVADAAYRSKKADYDSKESLFYIAVDRQEPSEQSKALLKALRVELDTLRDERDALKNQFDQAKLALDAARKDVAIAEARAAGLERADKERRKQFDIYQTLVQKKQWTLYDEVLASPVLDMFNSPYKIQQYTLNDLPIDYSFKYVTRYDRCTTCHLGMEKSEYDHSVLTSLTRKPEMTQAKLAKFREMLVERERQGKPTGGFKSADIPAELKVLPDSSLTKSRIEQFAAHPRLDLFAHPDSPHAAEKFGCTICHQGQGSATDFVNASHTPDKPEQREAWEAHKGWFSNHYWDYPMFASRFTESTCVKCHHEMTDLIRYGGKDEAPKLLEGYNLVRENGCFGCHEIAGTKNGRRIGPDMRLEPGVPLEFLSPTDRAKALADTNNPPGTLRKVGPSLYRLAEKTNPEWVSQWVMSPRGYRPDTRMPHFYGVSNNLRDELARTAPDQQDFPEAEVVALTAYLTYESQKYLDHTENSDPYRRNIAARIAQLKAREATLGEGERKELKELQDKLATDRMPTLELRHFYRPVKDEIIDPNGKPVELAAYPKDMELADRVKSGAKLFTERGCLACHQNSATTADEDGKRRDGTGLKGVDSVAVFGPNLSRLADKLGTKPGDKESGRRWLVQWLLNPNVHFPRTRMPMTYLSGPDADAVAVYLLEKSESWLKAVEEQVLALVEPMKEKNELTEKDQEALDNVEKIKDNRERLTALYRTVRNFAKLGAEPRAKLMSLEGSIPLAKPDSGTLRKLAAVYLQRVRPMKDVNDLLQIQGPGDQASAARWLKTVKADSDEAILAGSDNPQMQQKLADLGRESSLDAQVLSNATSDENLMRYIGRKAITRLGCYGCHNVPGFEVAKPIGTPLNDWGRKDPERLAFEDASAFVHNHFNVLEGVATPEEIDTKLQAIVYSPEVGAAPKAAADEVMNNEEMKDPVKRVPALLKIVTAAVESVPHLKAEVAQLGQEAKHLWLPKKPEKPGDRNKPPFEKFFAEALDHHSREGFLHLKLVEPRSFDYKRQRVWDDRLRMPQYRFASPSRKADESDEAFQSRALAAEAKSREAVMTFILGLVAEPIPEKFVHAPKPDRMAEIKGRQVLEKFNCDGCHQIRAGVVELRPNAEMTDALKTAYEAMTKSLSFKDDFVEQPFLRMHSSWGAPPQPLPDRMLIHGNVRPGGPDDEHQYQVFLTRALAFSMKDEDGKVATHEILAGAAPPLLIPKSQEIISVAPMYGGAFPNALNQYIASEYKGIVTDAEDARSKLPPSLLFEGERVQPEWLFGFLKDPQPVRPTSWMVLRMPKFNMSDDDARALVDYFAGADRLANVGIGLEYPYNSMPQRDEGYWRKKTGEYRSALKPEQLEERLNDVKPVWKLFADDRQADLKIRVEQAAESVKAAEAAVKAAGSDMAKADAAKLGLDTAKKDHEALTKEADDLKKQVEGGFKDWEKEWREEGVYASDAYRLLTKPNFCSKCHDIGSVKSAGVKAPPLEMGYQRLRPDWTTRWITHPQRLLPYNSPMPQNFLRTKEKEPASRVPLDLDGFDQVRAVSDVLMNFPRVAEMPANRYYRPTEGGK